MTRRKNIQERAELRAVVGEQMRRGLGRWLDLEGLCKLAADRGATSVEHDGFGGAHIDTMNGREWLSPEAIAAAAVDVI